MTSLPSISNSQVSKRLDRGSNKTYKSLAQLPSYDTLKKKSEIEYDSAVSAIAKQQEIFRSLEVSDSEETPKRRMKLIKNKRFRPATNDEQETWEAHNEDDEDY